jgi:hypothetical protein
MTAATGASRGARIPAAFRADPSIKRYAQMPGKTIVVQCAGKTFLHPILSDPDDDAPEFTCLDEDPVIVNLTDNERRASP